MPGRSFDDEFDTRGRQVGEDNIGLYRKWQRGYNITRFTEGYINDCYSTSPQAVYKVISFGRGIAAKNIMEYVNTRDGIDQTFYTESGEELKGQDEIDTLYKDWSSEFRKKGSGRGEQRHVTHMLLSADVEATAGNAERVLESARQTLWQAFGREGFEYTFVLHTDTEHPHVHAIVKNYNSRTKRKLRLDRHDFLHIRTEFAKTMTDIGLRKHVATLRRDRPELLHRIEDSMKRMHGQKERMDHLLDNCAFMNRKTQLNAQLTKQVGKLYDYQNTSIKFDSATDNHMSIEVNKSGKPFESVLKNIAIHTLGSKDFNIALTSENAKIHIRDSKGLSPEQQEEIKTKFEQLIQVKQRSQDKKIAQRTKDVLPQYRMLLLRTEKTMRWVRQSNLSIIDKRKQLKELKTIKHKLLNHYDIKAIQDASTLATGNTNLNVFKELDQITKKQANAKDYLRRKKTLDQWLDNQKKEVNNRVKYYGSKGDNQMVRLLKGMRSEKDYKALQRAQKKINERIVSKDR